MRIRGRLIPGQSGGGQEGTGESRTRYVGAQFGIDCPLTGRAYTVQLQHADDPDDGKEPIVWATVGEPTPIGMGETHFALPSGMKDRIRFEIRTEGGPCALSHWLRP